MTATNTSQVYLGKKLVLQVLLKLLTDYDDNNVVKIWVDRDPDLQEMIIQELADRRVADNNIIMASVWDSIIGTIGYPPQVIRFFKRLIDDFPVIKEKWMMINMLALNKKTGGTFKVSICESFSRSFPNEQYTNEYDEESIEEEDKVDEDDSVDTMYGNFITTNPDTFMTPAKGSRGANADVQNITQLSHVDTDDMEDKIKAIVDEKMEHLVNKYNKRFMLIKTELEALQTVNKALKEECEKLQGKMDKIVSYVKKMNDNEGNTSRRVTPKKSKPTNFKSSTLSSLLSFDDSSSDSDIESIGKMNKQSPALFQAEKFNRNECSLGIMKTREDVIDLYQGIYGYGKAYNLHLRPFDEIREGMTAEDLFTFPRDHPEYKDQFAIEKVSLLSKIKRVCHNAFTEFDYASELIRHGRLDGFTTLHTLLTAVHPALNVKCQIIEFPNINKFENSITWFYNLKTWLRQEEIVNHVYQDHEIVQKLLLQMKESGSIYYRIYNKINDQFDQWSSQKGSSVFPIQLRLPNLQQTINTYMTEAVQYPTSRINKVEHEKKELDQLDNVMTEVASLKDLIRTINEKLPELTQGLKDQQSLIATQQKCYPVIPYPSQLQLRKGEAILCNCCGSFGHTDQNCNFLVQLIFCIAYLKLFDVEKIAKMKDLYRNAMDNYKTFQMLKKQRGTFRNRYKRIPQMLTNNSTNISNDQQQNIIRTLLMDDYSYDGADDYVDIDGEEE